MYDILTNHAKKMDTSVSRLVRLMVTMKLDDAAEKGGLDFF
jgi:hypothetical protein